MGKVIISRDIISRLNSVIFSSRIRLNFPKNGKTFQKSAFALMNHSKIAFRTATLEKFATNLSLQGPASWSYSDNISGGFSLRTVRCLLSVHSNPVRGRIALNILFEYMYFSRKQYHKSIHFWCKTDRNRHFRPFSAEPRIDVPNNKQGGEISFST